MTAPHDAERQIRAYLDAGPTELPDRSYDAVRGHIERTRQRVAIGPWRTEGMSTFAKLASAAAAVVVLAVLGVSLLPGLGPGSDPTPTPAPSPTPVVTPTLVPTAPAPPVGDIPPGRYAWSWPDGRVSFDVPAGWRNHDSSQGGLERNRDTPAEIALANWLPGTRTEVTQVYDDACGADPTLIEVGPMTADLVAALEAQAGTTTTVTDVEIGGLPASRIDVTIDPAIDPTTCRHAPDGPIQVWFQDQSGYLALWTGSDGAYGNAVIWSVDVGDDRVIFTTGSHADTPPADVAAVDAIVTSMTFE